MVRKEPICEGGLAGPGPNRSGGIQQRRRRRPARFGDADLANCPVTNALPKDLATALQPFSKMPNSILAIDAANVLVLRDNAENIKRMMDIIHEIDVVPIEDIKSIVIPIKYALASDIAQVLSSLTAVAEGAQPRWGVKPLAQAEQWRRGPDGGGMTGALVGVPRYHWRRSGQPGYNQMGGGLSGAGMSSSTAGRSSFSDRLRASSTRLPAEILWC